jgi:UDP-N-acetylmuramyl pentapeptide synthase
VAAFDGPGGAFSTLDELLEVLCTQLTGPLHILVKGSRSMHMERVVAALDDAAAGGGKH